ncbi:MAG: single-stranded DNA-binding protein [Oscillospiraceae bacterium]|jgi:single-strand DNA-binding protein|nr:single-stranded DNA-binding protein [Oscillospiraceae bacterium]
MAFNQIIILGNLGKDAEVKALENGTKVITFNVAVTERWKDKNEQDQEHTDWFTVDYFTMSDKVAQYLKKGTSVMVEGRMTSREYEKDGQKRTAWSVRVNNLQLLGGKKDDVKSDTSDAPF